MLLLGWLVVLIAPVLAQFSNMAVAEYYERFARQVVLVGAFLLISAGHAWARWAMLNAPVVIDDIAFAKQALMLRQALRADATIAATWLGAPSYFTELRSIDLLGKTDKHIARLPGSLPFRPGHNKMDLAYSIGTLHPDVVLLDTSAIAAYGYIRLPNGIWIRPELLSTIANRSSVAASWCDSPTESSYCPEVR
jgi:hypothetical protein